jgi:hypothetical protein
MINFIYSLYYSIFPIKNENIINEEEEDDFSFTQFKINDNELKNINLQKININFENKNKENNKLQNLLNEVKLKHIDTNILYQKKEYEPKHPVLKEMLNKTNKIY